MGYKTGPSHCCHNQHFGPKLLMSPSTVSHHLNVTLNVLLTVIFWENHCHKNTVLTETSCFKICLIRLSVQSDFSHVESIEHVICWCYYYFLNYSCVSASQSFYCERLDSYSNWKGFLSIFISADYLPELETRVSDMKLKTSGTNIL